MPHFTYQPPKPSRLMQGDILTKSPAIENILREVHPHYLREDYKYFIVLTQSCDLERRDQEPCKSPYITIAAIRSLDLLLEREIAKQQKTEVERRGGLCGLDRKQLVVQFMERLLNNNEPDYFYLNDDVTLGFPNKMVAFLKLSVAIKTSLHFDACLSSKILELTEAFRAKLGWLAGNIYSRVGTQDWAPELLSKAEFRTLIESILAEHVVWAERKLIAAIDDKCKGRIEAVTKDQILDLHKTIMLKKDRDILLERLEHVILDSGYVPDPENVKKIVTRINNDPFIAQKFP